MKAVPILFWILAIIHLVPALTGIFPSKISSLYGVSADNSTQIILLQHRAILLGLVGAAFVCAAHMEAVRIPVLIGGTISMAGFIVICAAHGGLNGSLGRIALVDALALPLVVAILFLMKKP